MSDLKRCDHTKSSCPECGEWTGGMIRGARGRRVSDLKQEYPDPSESDLVDPAFEAIWQAIKGWDLSREQADGMYSGATGNDVMHILNALRKVVPAESEQVGKELATLVVQLLEGAKLTPKAYDMLPRAYELIRLIGFEGEPAGAAEAGKAQGCATGDVLEVGTAPNGDCEVILRCSKEQARRWSKLLYTTVTVLPAPPTKEPTNG